MTNAPLLRDDLGRAMRRGARWVLVGQGLSQLLSLGTLAVLYRLLSQEEFGLFGMALPFVMLPRTLATLGLSAATVQRQELDSESRSQLFWMQTCVGLLVGVGTWWLAMPVAWMYDVAAIGPLIQALAATVLLASLAATHQALLERTLQLSRVTAIRLAGQTLGAALAILCATRGWGAHALVVQQYGELIAVLAANLLAQPWLPHVPRWRKTAWRELAVFGGLYSVSSVLFILAQNVDKVLLGLWLGDTPAGRAVVGAYTQAYNLMMRPVYLVTTPLSGVLLPALSRSGHDPAQFGSLTANALRITADVLLPVSMGVWLVAVDAMSLLGGEQWRDAGMLLGCLAPVIALQGWINLCGSVLAARGRAGLLCFGALMVLLIVAQGSLLGIYVGAQLWAPPLGAAIGLAIALSVTTCVVLGLPYVSVTLTAGGVSLGQILRQVLPALRATAAMGLLVVATQSVLGDVAAGVRLPVAIGVGALCYGLLMIAELRWFSRFMWQGR